MSSRSKAHLNICFHISHPQMQNLDELEEQVVISLLAEIVDKLQRENQKLSTKQAQIQVG